MVDKDQGRTVGQMKVRTMPAVRAGERPGGGWKGAVSLSFVLLVQALSCNLAWTHLLSRCALAL